MKLSHFQELGEPFKCKTGTTENFQIKNLNHGNREICVTMEGSSVFLERAQVEDLATTLLFWLDQTDPNKEAE